MQHKHGQTHTNKQQPDALQSSPTTPTHHNTHRWTRFTARNAISWFSTCTNRGMVCMLAISPRLIGSLASICKAPVQPSTISSIRTPSCEKKKKVWQWEENINSDTKGTWSPPNTGTLMLIGLYFDLPLEASAYMWGWIKRPTRIYGKSMHR